jgi:hypothetical protein
VCSGGVSGEHNAVIPHGANVLPMCCYCAANVLL